MLSFVREKPTRREIAAMNLPIAFTNRCVSRLVTISKLRSELAVRNVSDLTNQTPLADCCLTEFAVRADELVTLTNAWLIVEPVN